MSRCEHPSPIDAIVIDMDATEPVQVHPPPLGGRRVLRQRWAELASAHDVELVLCIASAVRRGLLDATEAARHERQGPSIHPGFELAGLGQLIDAAAGADRLVTFGA